MVYGLLTEYSQHENWTWNIVLIALVIFLATRWLFGGKKKHNLPPHVVGLPLLGYLPFLGKEPFKDLVELRKKYGNVFSMYMGRTYVIFLCDYTAVKEAFNQSATIDRPAGVFDFMPDHLGFGSANGDAWVEQRRYCVRAMRDLGMGRSPWEKLVQEEVSDFVKLVAQEGGRPFDFNPILTSSVSNNISALIFGKRLPMDDPTREFLNESVDVTIQYFNLAGIQNYFPKIRDFLVKLGLTQFAPIYKKMVEFNNYVRGEVELRRKETNRENSDIFIDGYLKEIENNKENKLGNSFNDVNLRGNVQTLFIGGSDTTRTAISWLLIAMASFPDIQDKVHQELDTVLGKEGQVTWAERSKVPYTFATIMEGLRWKTITPLTASRITTEDIKVCGYDVPKGSTIIPNVWALHNDPRYWQDPEKFNPERFLTDGGKQVTFKPESFTPFSYGKRNCPGETVAMIEILCYFTALMQKFIVLPLQGHKPKMDAILGLTYQPLAQMLRFVTRDG